MKEKRIVMFLITATIISLALSWYGTTLKRSDVPPMAKQNIVCDTGYGVQYFEYKGQLTLRVNHEGRPIRCYE